MTSGQVAFAVWRQDIGQRNGSCPGQVRVGWCEAFIMLLRTVNNSKLMNCLLVEFFIQYFQTTVDYK